MNLVQPPVTRWTHPSPRSRAQGSEPHSHEERVGVLSVKAPVVLLVMTAGFSISGLGIQYDEQPPMGRGPTGTAEARISAAQPRDAH